MGLYRCFFSEPFPRLPLNLLFHLMSPPLFTAIRTGVPSSNATASYFNNSRGICCAGAHNAFPLTYLPSPKQRVRRLLMHPSQPVPSQ
ncbi:unnamed protein product [Nezara viridula]|uniref:Uncharacterized protein n=1 Tax=Nezara viridula TaxID=85310 RepID=A0A9P0E158_NEZVI|nr:unnamed protein product [Nezara viridula]